MKEEIKKMMKTMRIKSPAVVEARLRHLRQKLESKKLG